MPEQDQNQTGVDDAQAAAAQQTGDVQDQTAAAGQEEQPQTVPLASLEDERSKRQAAEHQVEQFRTMMMQNAAMQQAMQQQQPQQQQAQPTQDVLAQMGLTPDDLYTEQGSRRFAEGMQRMVQEQVGQAARVIRAELVHQQLPDYNELVGTQTPMGFQAAPALQRALKDNPMLQQQLMAIPDQAARQQHAYAYAKMAKQVMDLEARQAPAPSQQDIAANVQARTAPMSPAAVGGGGAFTAAQAVGAMTDEQFEQLDREAASS